MNKIFTKISSWVRADLWRACFAAAAVLSFFAMPILSGDAGMSGDEYLHFDHSKNVISFYKTFGRDTSAISPSIAKALELYGNLPDNLSYIADSILGTDDIVRVRHWVCAGFGWLCLLFCGLLAFRAGRSWRAAVIALLLLFCSPRFLGHSFNNLKDIPFAALMMMGVYFLMRLFQTFPKPPMRIAAMAAVSIGLTIAVRVGGLLLIAYFAVFAVFYLVCLYFGKGLPKNKFKPLLVRLIWYGVGISLAGYAIGVLLWPYAMVSPISNVAQVLATMSKFFSVLRQLFEGKMQWSDALPWYYTPKYILVTIPIAVIAGMALYPFVGGFRRQNVFSTLVVYFAFIFPIFWIIYSNANVYGGWRHSLFAYPPIAAAAALGFNALIGVFKNRYVKIALTALPLVCLTNPIIFIVKNHPYEYVYFNRFAGGIKGAYGNYEMDYYYHSTRRAAEWVRRDALQSGIADSITGAGGKVRVVSWHSASVQYFLRHDTAKFSVGFARWYERGFGNWDYAIFTITGMPPEILKNKRAFPPKNTAYQIKVDGIPVCLVLKRTNRDDFYGHKAMQEGRAAQAAGHLKTALQYDPYNEQALEDLITIYEQTGRPDSALTLAEHWISFNRGSTTALNHLANLYFAQGKYSNALLAAGSIIKYNSRDVSGLWIAAHIYAAQDRPQDAIRTLQKLLSIRGDHIHAYHFLAEMFDRTGNKRQAEEIRRAVGQ